MISDSENSKAQYKTAIKVARKGAESTRINSRDLSVKVTFEPAKKKKIQLCKDLESEHPQAARQQKALRWAKGEKMASLWSRLNKGAGDERRGTEKGKEQIRQGMEGSWNCILFVTKSHWNLLSKDWYNLNYSLESNLSVAWRDRCWKQGDQSESY